jgi:hypothetical protein
MKLAIGYWPIIVDGQEKAAETKEESKQAFKELRDILLKESDWMFSVDSPLTDEQKAEWTTWRTYLRDLPSTWTTRTTFTKGLEITDPPLAYRPSTWANVEIETIEAQIAASKAAYDAQKAAELAEHEAAHAAWELENNPNTSS